MVTEPQPGGAAPSRCHGPHSIACILPPHMLRAIVERGSPEQRAWALQALTVSERIRGRRELLGDLAAMTALPTGGKQRAVLDADGNPAPDSPARSCAARGSGQSRTSQPTRPTTARAPPGTSITTPTAAAPSTIAGCPSCPRCTPVAYDNAFWDGEPDGFGRWRRKALRPLHEVTGCDRPRAHPRRDRERGRTRLLWSSRVRLTNPSRTYSVRS